MLIGHQKQWQYLKKLAERDKLPHAFLFSGQEKLGKKTLAMEFVSLLLKEDVTKKQHPDFVFVSPIKKEIQIFQIRDCIWRLSLKPSISSFKVAIIDQAHCMNQEAQNCFLKTLEEPKGRALLILISEYPEALFPTILSRVQKIKFYPVKRSEIKDYLQKNGVVEKETEEIIKFSLGRPGEVIDFISNPQKLKAQKKVISDLIKISSSDLASRFQYVKNLSADLTDLKETLNIWLLHFRDILISGISRPKELYGFTPRDSLRYSLSKLKNIIKLIQKTNFLLSTTNVNPRLALEILILEL